MFKPFCQSCFHPYTKAPNTTGISTAFIPIPHCFQLLIHYSAVQSAIYDVMVFFIRTSPQLFDDCLYKHADQKQNAAAEDATRERRWEALRDKANSMG